MIDEVPVSTGAGDAPRAGRRRANELRALSRLAFQELQAFPGAVRDMHLGIAGRAFRGAGPTARPVKLMHDSIARTAYGAVSSGAQLVGRLVDATIEARGIGRDRELSATRGGSSVIAALNGLIGDRLERTGSELHQSVSVRVHGRPVPLDTGALSEAFPEATPRLVVFLHGLMGTEFLWEWGGERRGDTYGARLAAELCLTPIYLRYNSGLHISESGRSVASLLDQLIAAWPAEVREIAFVGHSMGGLVARSACHHGSETGQRWPERVHQIVSLGTPHLGAPLAQATHLAAEAFSTLPETRMLGAFLRRRSSGIRDLRHGSLVDEDWRDRDPDALRAAVCKEVPPLPGATHYFVSATITRSPNHPFGRLLGDILVLVPSATAQGRTRRFPFEAEHHHHLAPAHHLSLLNHPDVYARLREWLEPRGG